MPQLHLYLAEDVASLVRQHARARNMTVSGYLADLVQQQVASGWPAGYFEHVVGAWQGEPLRRPPQGRSEQREKL